MSTGLIQLHHGDILTQLNGERINQLLKILSVQTLGFEAIMHPVVNGGVAQFQIVGCLEREHQVYSYLLRNMTIKRVDQVWSTEITYLPVLKGHFYLVAIMDWFSRKELAWRISNTLDVQFCVEALQEALCRYSTPEIFNSDQEIQYSMILS
jgi:transposase InsO family protein